MSMSIRFDAHCHAWSYWPYQPPVPDPESRSSTDQLLYEMAQNNIDCALIVCAEISTETNNNAYIASAVQAHPDKFYQVVELDSHWKPTYHTMGAVDRLQALVDAHDPVGFTHYLADDDDGRWLLSDDGKALFEFVQDNRLIASIHAKPQHMASIAELARMFPRVPILIHHFGHPQVNQTDDLDAVLQMASFDNVYLKASGFYYGTRQAIWDFPLADMQPLVKTFYQRFGADRLFWGSDFPVCGKKGMTYIQSVEILASHCRFIHSDDLDKIMGQSLYDLVQSRAK